MAGRCIICGEADGACHHSGLPSAPRYKPLSLERMETATMHTLKSDLYVDIDGNPVDARDPKVQTFVGVKGSQIAEDDARRYGLIGTAHAAEHDEGSDPDTAADPVVGGVPAPDGDVEKTGRAKK